MCEPRRTWVVQVLLPALAPSVEVQLPALRVAEASGPCAVVGVSTTWGPLVPGGDFVLATDDAGSRVLTYLPQNMGYLSPVYVPLTNRGPWYLVLRNQPPPNFENYVYLTLQECEPC